MPEQAERYIDQVLRRIIAPATHTARLRDDLEGHFREAAERGEPANEVMRRLGPPEEVAASFMEGVDLRLAGFWERLVAFFGDAGLGLALLLPFAALCGVLAPIVEESAAATSSPVLPFLGIAALILFGLGMVGVGILYFPVLEHLYGTTFGKRALALRVVTEGGAPISLGAAFIRRISFYFELLWLDALFIPFTEKKQRAFDIVAKTLVVRDPNKDRGIGGWLLCLAPWVLIIVVGCAVALVAGS